MCSEQFIMLLHKKLCLHETQRKELGLSFVNPRKESAKFSKNLAFQSF